MSLFSITAQETHSSADRDRVVWARRWRRGSTPEAPCVIYMQLSGEAGLLRAAEQGQVGLVHTDKQGGMIIIQLTKEAGLVNPGTRYLCRAVFRLKLSWGRKLLWTFSANIVNSLLGQEEAFATLLSLTWGRRWHSHGSEALGFLMWLYLCHIYPGHHSQAT